MGSGVGWFRCLTLGVLMGGAWLPRSERHVVQYTHVHSNPLYAYFSKSIHNGHSKNTLEYNKCKLVLEQNESYNVTFFQNG